MKIIVLSHLFPNSYKSSSGIFVKEQIKTLYKLSNKNIEIVVIQPVPYSPKILWFNDKWKKYGKIKSEDIMEANIKIHRPKYLVFPGKKTFLIDGISMFLATYKMIKKIVKNTSEEVIIHAHTIYPCGFVTSLLKILLKVKTIVTVHGSDINIHPKESLIIKTFTKFALKNNDKIITVSNNLKEKTLKLIGNCNLQVITNGVSLEKFELENEDKDKVVNIKNEYKNKKIILFVGNFIKLKGIRELLIAISKLSKRYNNFVLLLIGKGELKKNIEEFINKNKLKEYVKVIGHINHNKIKYWFNAASIFVLPSYSEGMPTVMFEAMITRNAIIISDVGGVSEVIENNYNGKIISPKDSGELYKELGNLINNDQLRDYLSNNAYKEVKANYTWERNAKKTLKVYNEVLSSE